MASTLDHHPEIAPHAPLRVGLTGNIGSGKSSVAQLLAELGAYVIDADALAREATSDAGVLARIASELGSELVVAGQLDRAATGALVFSDAAARERLNGIVHPWVEQRRRQLEELAAGSVPPPEVVVHDVPLLYEVGLDRVMDCVVVVYAPLALRLQRLAARSGLRAQEASARDAAQLPLDAKAAMADFVIDNSAGRSELALKVARLWQELIALARGARRGSDLPVDL